MRERLGPIFQVIKTALAAGLAWELSVRLLHIQVPFFAPLAVILVMQATIADTVQRAVNRIIGVVAGVLVSVVILNWLQAGAVGIVVTLLAAMLIPTLLRINPLVTMQVGVTALMVVIMHGGGIIAVARVLETVLGGLVAIVVNALVIPPDLGPQAEQRVWALTDLLEEDLVAVSREPRETTRTQRQARACLIEKRINEARDALRTARQSIKYNPFLVKRSDRLGHLERAMPELAHMAVQVGGILHGLHDLGTDGHPAVDGLNRALRETGECIGALGRVLVGHSPEGRERLAKELEDAQESQSECLGELRQLGTLPAVRENGAILTDLNRIVTEIEHALALSDGRQATAELGGAGAPGPARA